jgi:hypothetical protein
MVTQHLSSTHTLNPGLDATAQHLYDAECALHVAHQSHVDAWITAASDRLHEALVEYLAVQAASPGPAAMPRRPDANRRGRTSPSQQPTRDADFGPDERPLAD